MSNYTLFNAIEDQGYQPSILLEPSLVKNALGDLNDGSYAKVFRLPKSVWLPNDKIAYYGIAMKENSWGLAYQAAHEIAEHQHGFQHTAEMFCAQANLLADWIVKLTHDR